MGNLFLDEEYKGAVGEYLCCIFELIKNERIDGMKGMKKHGDIDCFEHCLFVSYYSFLACRRLGLDYRCAARGGLLHDFYLYNKYPGAPSKQRTQHPKIALENAAECFELCEKEKDIILKHMWPITLRPPKYKESYVVDFVDKYCTYLEITNSDKLEILEELKRYISY